MVTHGSAAIFRMPEDATPTTTEDSITEKVELGGEGLNRAQVPDALSAIGTINPKLKRHYTEIPAPFSNRNLNADAGFSSSMHIINIVIDETETVKSTALQSLVDWTREENIIRGKFEFGRIGFRNDHRPEFNLTPDNTAGYKIVGLDITQEDQLAKVHVEVMLLFGGDPQRLGQ